MSGMGWGVENDIMSIRCADFGFDRFADGKDFRVIVFDKYV